MEFLPKPFYFFSYTGEFFGVALVGHIAREYNQVYGPALFDLPFNIIINLLPNVSPDFGSTILAAMKIANMHPM
ncbi:hypothetical protein AXW93_03760 [Pseudomonas aeruginosa]|nr:hypothetical protein AXW93_03760 [Pseudomonas aeruginosa]